MDRVHECVSLCIKFGLLLVTGASLILLIFATPLVRLFTTDPAVVDVGTSYIRIMAFIQWAYVMSFIHIGYLQAVKKPIYGFIESIIRKIILPVGIFHLLVTMVGIALTTFFLAMVAINIVMTAVTILYAQWVLRSSMKTKAI